jgi:6-phosphogluconolactonase/glucosamine-6-phosphate isomerase/deaminase
MIENVQKVINQQHVISHKNTGITVCVVKNPDEGFDLVKKVLYEIIDKKTVLYLSGGSLHALYKELAQEELLEPGAVGLIDERFGKKFHKNSNELMLRESGLYRYLQLKNIPFYPILQQDKDRDETTDAYDQLVRSNTANFQKSVGLLGIGPDGHTSSLAPNRRDFRNPMFSKENEYMYVSEFNDPKSNYGERIGMLFLGLSMLDYLIVAAFGTTKQKALKKLFDDGAEEEVPARFFKRPEIAKKTVLITDQEVF